MEDGILPASGRRVVRELHIEAVSKKYRVYQLKQEERGYAGRCFTKGKNMLRTVGHVWRIVQLYG